MNSLMFQSLGKRRIDTANNRSSAGAADMRQTTPRNLPHRHCTSSRSHRYNYQISLLFKLSPLLNLMKENKGKSELLY